MMADLMVVYAQQIFIILITILGTAGAYAGLKRLLRGKKMYKVVGRSKSVYRLRREP